MRRQTTINLLILLITLIAYVIMRADAWRLLVFTDNTSGIIVKVKEMNSDPHTTAFKVRVNYSFSAENGKIYHGSGDRVLRKGENTENISWLNGTAIDVVYISDRPEINEISGREYAVLFPLVLVPFVLMLDALSFRRSRFKK